MSKEKTRAEAAEQLLGETAEALKNALMVILSNQEDDFVDDETGEELAFEDGGNYSEYGEIYRYGEYEFDFREAMKLCAEAGHPFPEDNGSTRNNRAFLQQFATRAGAEAAMRRIKDAVKAERSSAF